jgi:methyl-accepting chemotaxis protein
MDQNYVSTIEVIAGLTPFQFFVESEGVAAEVSTFDFDSAIEAHRAWKVKLRMAIAEHERLDAYKICRDDECPLGKWIHGLGGTKFGTRQMFTELLGKHAEFHQRAGAEARKINAGDYSDAEREIGSGSDFARVSTEVATLLLGAKREM